VQEQEHDDLLKGDAKNNTSHEPSAEEAPEATEEAAAVQKQLDVLKDQLLRAMADMENMQKRAVREQEEARKWAVAGLARDLLGVADNLRRALASIPAPDQTTRDLGTLVQGLEMVEKDLLSALEKAKVVPFASLHQKFDAGLHQAVLEVETADHPPGVVVQVIQEGYHVHERLLRPAMVGVSRMPPAPPGDTPQAPVEGGA
jgi:molecular chaperone GrpE